MRIDLGTRRRGSLALEAVMIIPMALVIIFLARFVMEGMLTRHEISVHARVSAVALATESGNATGCETDALNATSGAGVQLDGSATTCTQTAERGLRSEQPFFDALEDGASAWTDLARHVDDGRPTLDVVANATGSMEFDNPPFLSNAGEIDSGQSFMLPKNDLWPDDDRWENGHDRVIWDELAQENTTRLFPNLFPARNR